MLGCGQGDLDHSAAGSFYCHNAIFYSGYLGIGRSISNLRAFRPVLNGRSVLRADFGISGRDFGLFQCRGLNLLFNLEGPDRSSGVVALAGNNELTGAGLHIIFILKCIICIFDQ